MRNLFSFGAQFVLALISVAQAQPPPVLDPPILDTAGVLTLRLEGSSHSNYTFEASVDLADWWPLVSTVASNGSAALTYATEAQDGSRYFRARLNVPLPPIQLAPGQEAFPRALALVTPEEGGAMSFTDSAGVVYTLTVPTNAVTAPQVFTMTLVTNVEGLPFSAGPLGAIVIQPEGTELLARAELEMEFPTNVQNAVAFTFTAAGEDLRVLPAETTTNRMQISLWQLGGVGASLATFAEIEQVARTYSATQSGSGLAKNGASTERPARGAVPELGPLFF